MGGCAGQDPLGRGAPAGGRVRHGRGVLQVGPLLLARAAAHVSIHGFEGLCAMVLCYGICCIVFIIIVFIEVPISKFNYLALLLIIMSLYFGNKAIFVSYNNFRG